MALHAQGHVYFGYVASCTEQRSVTTVFTSSGGNGENCIPTTQGRVAMATVLTVGVVPLVAVVAAAVPVAGLFSVPALPPLCRGRETHPHTPHGHSHCWRTQLAIHSN